MSKILTPKSFKAQIERAVHNLTQEKRTTLHPMLAIPIYYRRMFKGDKFEFGIMESLLQSEPTFAPLLANWKLQFEWYFDSDANRYGWVDNNTRLSAEEVMTRVHHSHRTNKIVDSFDGGTLYEGIGRGGVADYAGIPPKFFYSTERPADEYGMLDGNYLYYNIDFHLTYLNIIRNYHVNKQFPFIPYVNKFNEQVETIADSYDTYSLTDMDNLFMFLRSCPNGVAFQQIYESENDGTYTCDAPDELKSYYNLAIESFCSWLESTEDAFGGLFCTQFEPNLFENLLSKDRNLLRSQVTISNDGFTIEQFRLKNHLQGLYDKIFVSGGTDRDLSRTIWGIESNRDYDIPELLCVHSEIIGTNLVTSTTAGSASYNGANIENAPGSLAGNINTRRGKGRFQKFEAKTSGSLMCLVSLTPLVDYNQGFETHLVERNFMDEFTPDMARKGFEDIPLASYCALPAFNAEYESYTESDGYLDSVVGKQVAWLREMTATNRSHGEFSNGGEKEDWILRRDFMTRVGLQEGSYEEKAVFTPYGNPLAFQYPFVSQTILDPNFYLQVAIYNKAYRPIPRRFMPNLGY